MTIPKKLLNVKKDFDMKTTTSCVFHHSQWESCVDGEHASLSYLLYRILFMLILISSLTFSTLCQSYLFGIFLTNWSFTLQTLYSILFCFNIVWAKRDYLRRRFQQFYGETSNVKSYELKETNSWSNSIDTNRAKDATCIIVDANAVNSNCVGGDDEPGNPTSALTTEQKKNNNNNQTGNKDDGTTGPSLLEKVIWILMNISHVLPYVVSLGYWIFVYEYDPYQLPCERFRSHFIVHGATSILALIDSLIVAVPVRKTHFIFPSCVLFAYAIFSYVYEAAGGPYREGKQFIYSILNWRFKPGRSVLVVIIGLIVSPVLHMVFCWGLHHMRLKLVSLTKRNKK